MIGLSSKEKDYFFNTSGSMRSFPGLYKSGNNFNLLKCVFGELLNRSIDPFDDGPAQDRKKLSVYINFRPAARTIGNIFSKNLKDFFGKISGDNFSTMIFFHAKDHRSFLFPSNTFPGVICSTGSCLLKSSKYSSMRNIQRAKRLITPGSFLKTISNKFNFPVSGSPEFIFRTH